MQTIRTYIITPLQSQGSVWQCMDSHTHACSIIHTLILYLCAFDNPDHTDQIVWVEWSQIEIFTFKSVLVLLETVVLCNRGCGWQLLNAAGFHKTQRRHVARKWSWLSFEWGREMIYITHWYQCFSLWRLLQYCLADKTANKTPHFNPVIFGGGLYHMATGDWSTSLLT